MKKVYVLYVETDYLCVSTHILGVFTRVAKAKEYANKIIDENGPYHKKGSWEGGFRRTLCECQDVANIYSIEKFNLDAPPVTDTDDGEITPLKE